MKTITNKTRKPMKVRLPGGKTLFLGATRQASVRDDALDHPPVKKLIEAGDLEVFDASNPKAGGGTGAGAVRGGGAAGQGGSRASIKTGDR